MVKSITEDYGRILNNSAGRFLNFLRDKSPDDKLLNKMDNAKTMAELKHIMSKSVRLHPIKLMQPIKTLYAHKSLEMMHIYDETGFVIVPFGVFSKDMILTGVGPRINAKISDNLHLAISGYITDLEYSNDINEYNGTSYGVGLDIIGNLSLDTFVRVYGDFNFNSFDVGPVFDGRGVKNDPTGIFWHITGEMGYRFDVNEYYISPFVMLGSNYTEISNDDAFCVFAGVGTNVGFSVVMDGLQYDYAVRGIVRLSGEFGVSLNTSAWSIMDVAGVDMGIGALYDEQNGVSYQVSLEGKFSF